MSVFAVALLVASCGADDAVRSATQGPSAVHQGVTQREADEALGALCGIAEGRLVERDTPHAAFNDHAHETLHVVADLAEPVDPVAAAALLEAKFAVESDLERDPSPASLPDDAKALARALTAALGVIGLHASSCSA